jgi:hypothetical protein
MQIFGTGPSYYEKRMYLSAVSKVESYCLRVLIISLSAALRVTECECDGQMVMGHIFSEYFGFLCHHSFHH